nr:MAG TPA: hypothetical protein [Caudoviricetes sp.]
MCRLSLMQRDKKESCRFLGEMQDSRGLNVMYSC